MLALGVQDALTALAEGPGVSAKRAYDMAVKYDDATFFNSN